MEPETSVATGNSEADSAWWIGTELDLSYLGEQNLINLAALSHNTKDFISKYVTSKNISQLKKDVQNALQTTEEYASDFAERVVEYFSSNFNTENSPSSDAKEPEAVVVADQIPENIPSLPNVVATVPTEDRIADAHESDDNKEKEKEKEHIEVVNVIIEPEPEQEVHIGLQQTDAQLPLQVQNVDLTQQFIQIRAETRDIARSTVKDFSEQTQKQMSGLHDDIKFLQENQKKLVESFNQLRSFVEDFSQRIEQRINKQEAKIDTIEQRFQNLDMNMNRGPLIGNGPNLQFPGVPLVPVQQQPQMFPYKTIGPVVGTTPTQVQIQPQTNPQTSIAVQQQRDNQYPAQEINELMNQTNFQVIDRDKANIQITGKAIKFNKNETVVFLDYLSLDNIVSITWRAYFQGEPRFSYGFMMDNENVANNTQSLNTAVSYNSNGNILVKQRREYSEPIRSGDLVRIELNNSEHTAQFFKKGVVLPFLIRKISPVNVFFVKAQYGVQVQLMDLREDPIAQASVPPRNRKDLDNY